MKILTTIASVLYIAVPVTAGLFSFWADSKKDGFDQERALDLILLGFIGGLFTSLISFLIMTKSLSIGAFSPNPYAFILGFVAVSCIVALCRKWSLYRILDNLATSLIAALIFLLLLQNFKRGIRPLYFIGPVFLVAVNYSLHKLQESIMKSGLVYCLVALTFCVTAALASPKFPNLIFLALLFTLSSAVLIFRLLSLYGRSKVDNSSTRSS